MSVWREIIRHEWRLQWRSLRFRAAVAVYLTFGAMTAWAVTWADELTVRELGPASYLASTLTLLPVMTALLAIALAGNTARQPGTEQVLLASPVSNAGFLLGKWLGSTTLIVPLSFVPCILALIPGYLATGALPHGSLLVGPWLLHIVPVGLVVSALWLGWVTIVKNELAALLLGTGLALAVAVVADQVLYRFSLRLGGPVLGDDTGWLRLESAIQWLTRMRSAVFEQKYQWSTWWLAASEGSFDPRAALSWLVPRALPVVAITCFVFAVAVLLIGRTRRDLRPLELSATHPLRTFAGRIAGLRQQYAFDADLTKVDRLVAICGVVLALAAFGMAIGQRAQTLAEVEESWRAAVENPLRPMPVTMLPTSWSLRGRIEASGRVDVRVEGVFENTGAEPVAELVFEMVAPLALDDVTIDGSPVPPRRVHDRVSVVVEPPLAPGGRLELGARARGVPVQRQLVLPGSEIASFVDRFELLRAPRFAYDVADIGKSSVRRLADARAVELDAGSLGPLPRYASWELTPPAEREGFLGREIPVEQTDPFLSLTVDLEIPDSWSVADACGQIRMAGAGEGVRGQCEIALRGWRLLGGTERELVTSADTTVDFLVMPRHAELARRQLESIGRAIEIAMPGAADTRLVAAERVVPYRIDPREGMKGGYVERDGSRAPGFQISGHLLEVAERRLIDPEPMSIGQIGSSFRVEQLLSRRRAAPGEEHALRTLIEIVTRERMGVLESFQAALVAPPMRKNAFANAVLGAHPTSDAVWAGRLPALLAHLANRFGREVLYESLDAVVDAPAKVDGVPAELTVREYVARIEEATDVSLQAFYDDYFIGSSLPQLSLVSIEIDRPAPGRWEVSGALRNEGEGTTRCEVILSADEGRQREVVEVGPMGTEPFRFVSTSQPRVVELDPDRQCFRFEAAAPGGGQGVRIELEDGRS